MILTYENEIYDVCVDKLKRQLLSYVTHGYRTYVRKLRNYYETTILVQSPEITHIIPIAICVHKKHVSRLIKIIKDNPNLDKNAIDMKSDLFRELMVLDWKIKTFFFVLENIDTIYLNSSNNNDIDKSIQMWCGHVINEEKHRQLYLESEREYVAKYLENGDKYTDESFKQCNSTKRTHTINV